MRTFRAGLATIFFAASSSLVSLPAEALDAKRTLTQYVHDSWSTGEGLPQSTGLSLARSRDGFLWVGTEEGIARFDGMSFVVFNRKNTPGLPHNLAYALLGGHDGSLWVGTAAGLARFADGSARPFGAREGVPEKPVRCLLEDQDGAVWAGTWGGGLVRLAREVATVFTTRDGLGSDEVSSLHEDPDGTLWIATSGGLSRRTPEGRTELVPVTGARTTRFRGLCRGRDGSLWVGSDEGLFRVRPDGAARRFGSADGLPSEKVHTLASDRDGNVWVATAAGLCRVARRVGLLLRRPRSDLPRSRVPDPRGRGGGPLVRDGRKRASPHCSLAVPPLRTPRGAADRRRPHVPRNA